MSFSSELFLSLAHVFIVYLCISIFMYVCFLFFIDGSFVVSFFMHGLFGSCFVVDCVSLYIFIVFLL